MSDYLTGPPDLGIIGATYPDLAVWANSLDGPPDLSRVCCSVQFVEQDSPTFPSIEGNEFGFQLRSDRSGGAAKIIAAQGFNPGSVDSL